MITTLGPVIGALADLTYGYPLQVSVLCTAPFTIGTGDKVYVDIAQFLQGPDTLIPIGIPASGYIASYPAAPGTVLMSVFGLLDNVINVEVELERDTSTRFYIRVRMILNYDLGDYITGNQIGNIAQVTQEGLASNIYTSGASFIMQVILLDGVVIEYGRYTGAISARSLCQDHPFSYELIDNGFGMNPQSVLGFRSNDLSITFAVNSPDVVNPDYYFAIFEETGVLDDPSLSFVDNLNYQMTEVIGIDTFNTVFNIPNSAIIRSGVFVNIAPTFIAGVTIDIAYFDTSKCYRAYIVYETTNGWHSCKTNLICNDIVYTPITGDSQITGELATIIYDNQCFGDIAPCTLVDICVRYDKVIYNADIISNGYMTDFDTNFESVSIFYSTTPPVNGLDVNAQSLDYTTVEDATQFIACKEFLIPDDWAGTIMYLIFRFEFDLVSHKDVFFHYWKFDVNSAGKGYFDYNIEDAAGDPVTQICEGDTGLIKMILTSTNLPDVDYYSTGALIDGLTGEMIPGIIKLNEDYAAGNVEYNFNAEDIAIGQQPCLKLAVVDKVPTAGVCICHPFELIQTVNTLDGTDEAFLSFDFDFAPLINSQIERILVKVAPKGKAGPVTHYEFLGTAVGSGNFSMIIFNESILSATYFIKVILTNGCEYDVEVLLSTNAVAGATETGNELTCECFGCAVIDTTAVAPSEIDFTSTYRWTLKDIDISLVNMCDSYSIKATSDLITFYDCSIISVINTSGTLYDFELEIPSQLRYATPNEVIVMDAGLVFEFNYLYNDVACGPDVQEYILATFARTTSPNGCGLNLTAVTPQTPFPVCGSGTYTLEMFDSGGSLLDTITGALPLSVQDAGHTGLANFVLSCASWNGAKFQIASTTCP